MMHSSTSPAARTTGEGWFRSLTGTWITIGGRTNALSWPVRAITNRHDDPSPNNADVVWLRQRTTVRKQRPPQAPFGLTDARGAKIIKLMTSNVSVFSGMVGNGQ